MDTTPPTIALSLLVVAVLAAAPPLAGQAIELPLDAADATWRGAQPVADGWQGGAARFDGNQAHIEAGPCPVASSRPFTLRCALRTTHPGFCTPLMARDGEQVGLSLVLGRQPGRVSFEAWSWQRTRLLSRSRIDDGQWHEIEVAFDPRSTVAMLWVDGALEATAELGPGAAPTAQLRLGNNIGAHQPFKGDLDGVSVAPVGPPAELLAFAAPVLPTAEREAALASLRAALLPATTPSLDPAALSAWPARRRVVREHVRDCLGLTPWPERPPLDVRVHGRLERDGVAVERISFRAFDHSRATGWLWTPVGRRAGRHPAVLCPHGHWQAGAREAVVQARCASFARFGWTALAIDSVHPEHIAAGQSPLGAMTWHNLRGIQLLRERADVDAERIAATGCSGGGQQTYYLMALTDQLAAAAPICMACYFKEIIADTSAHCGCNHLPRLAHGTDVIEMSAVFAPRPAFFGSVTGDWTHRFPSEGLPELQRLWADLGGADQIRSLHLDEGHGFSKPMREAVYGFLHDAFAGRAHEPGSTVAEPEFQPFDPRQLQALGGPAADALIASDRAAASLLERRSPLERARELAPGLPWEVAASDIEWRGPEGKGWRGAVVRGADRVPVPFLVRDVAAAGQGGGVGGDTSADRWVVFVAGQGKAGLIAQNPRFLSSRPRAVAVDARGFGEWAPFAAAWRRNGLLLGRGELYQAAHDVALVCESLPEPRRVTLVGLGDGGFVAVVAATLSGRVRDLITDDLGPGYAEAPNRTPHAPEVLRRGGLLGFLRDLDGCEYQLGGATRMYFGSPRRDLRSPILEEELWLLLLPDAK